MKKIIAVICALTLAFALGGCGSDKEDYENVSRIENYYFIGESESFVVILTAGQKESPTIIDGSAGKLGDYARLTLEVKSGYSDEYSYQIAVGEEGYAGTFKSEIVGGNMYAEFETSNFAELSYKVIITHSGTTEEVYLESVITSDMIKWNEAKAVAEKELSSNISEMQSEISDNYEVYIKFVYDSGNAKGSWYVAYANGDNLSAVLIDPTSGSITAKRE
ncbi:MAG: hypothetical protein R3Y65_06115 [Bacillota bacterium]